MIGKSLLTLALAGSALGANVLNAPATIANIFKPAGAASDNTQTTFTLHLNSANMDGLTSRMESIASSGAPWLSDDELATYVRPTTATTNAVKSYLSTNGIPDSAVAFNSLGDQAVITTTVANAKKIFPSTNFSMYNFKSNSIVRTLALTLPDVLSTNVFHVSGLVDFPEVRRLAPANIEKVKEELLAKRDNELALRADATDCDPAHVTPSCLRQ